MQKFTLLFLSVIAFTANAQKILVPYRVDDKFGLSDENGVMMLRAVYSELKYLGSDNFMYTLDDSIGRTYGLIKNSKIILKGKKTPAIDLSHGIIFYKPLRDPEEPAMIYNIRGEELLPKGSWSAIRRDIPAFRKLDDAEDNMEVFLLEEHGSETSFSIAELNRKKGKVNILIRRARTIHSFDEISSYDNEARFTYFDSLSRPHKVVLFYNDSLKKFQLMSPGQRDALKSTERKIDDSDFGGPPSKSREGSLRGMRDGDGIKGDYDNGDLVYRSKRFSIDSQDSLRYGSTKVRIPGAVFYFNKKRPQDPVVYELGGKFGLVFSAIESTPATYDTLFPEESRSTTYYRAGLFNVQNEKWSYGLLSVVGKELLPVRFDSIHMNIPEVFFFNDSQSGELRFGLSTSAFRNKQVFCVFQNGKAGLRTHAGDTLASCVYDSIFSMTRGPFDRYASQVGIDYLVGKRNGRFEMITSAPEEWKNTSFPDLPVFYIYFYWGLTGKTLMALLNEDGRLYYASTKGRIYYQK